MLVSGSVGGGLICIFTPMLGKMSILTSMLFLVQSVVTDVWTNICLGGRDWWFSQPVMSKALEVRLVGFLGQL